VKSIRLFSAVVVLAIIAVASVPLLVLVDLIGDGDGLGLCPTGLGSCRTSYFHGPELLAALVVVIFALVMLLRVAFRLDRWLGKRRDKKRLSVPASPTRPRAVRPPRS
jgi:hypothetical protein